MSQLALLPEARPLADRLVEALRSGEALTFAELQVRLGCGVELAAPLAQACKAGLVAALRDPARYQLRSNGGRR